MINWIDVIIFVIILRFAFVGYRRGGVGELILTIGFIILCFLLYHFYNPIGSFLNSIFDIPSKYSNIVSYLLFITGGGILLWIGAKFITRLINVGILGVINRLLGIILGSIKGVILCSVILYSAVIFKLQFFLDLVPKSSISNKYIINFAPKLYDLVKNCLG